MRDIERAHQVHLDNGLECIDAHSMEDRVAQEACVVYDAVKFPKTVYRRPDDLAGRNCFRHGFETSDCRPPSLFDFLHYFFCWRGARSRSIGGDTRVIDHDLGAFGRAEQGDLAADAASCTRYDDGLTVQRFGGHYRFSRPMSVSSLNHCRA